MADEPNRGSKLTTEQKNETRAAMDAYRHDHPGANLKEILEHLDLPYKDKITEGVLRGLSARRGSANGRGRGGRRTAAETRVTARGRGGRARGQTMERLIKELNDLRRRREALDGQIDELESEVRDRLRETLGAESAGRILGGLFDRVGDAAGKVTSAVADRLS